MNQELINIARAVVSDLSHKFPALPINVEFWGSSSVEIKVIRAAYTPEMKELLVKNGVRVEKKHATWNGRIGYRIEGGGSGIRVWTKVRKQHGRNYYTLTVQLVSYDD